MGRILSDLEAERIVLGTLMRHAALISEVIEVLDVETFYLPFHRKVYLTLLHMFDEGQHIHITAVRDYWKAKSDVDIIRTDDLAKLDASVTALEHFGYFVEKVAETYHLRKLSHMASSLIAQIDEGASNSDSRSLAMQLQYDIYSLPRTESKEKSRTLEDIISDIGYERKGPILKEIREAFDEVVYCFQPGDLVLVTGAPQIGKSALVLEWSLRALECDTKVALFTPTMGAEYVTWRLLAMLAQVDLRELQTGLLPSDDSSALAQCRKQLTKIPLFINDNAKLTDLKIFYGVRRLVSDFRVGLVVVDGVEDINVLVDGSGHHLGERLKEWAMDQEVILVAVSSQGDDDKKKSYHKELLQIADEIICIEEGEGETERRMVVSRHRHGPTGVFIRSWISGAASYDWERPPIDEKEENEGRRDVEDDIPFT